MKNEAVAHSIKPAYRPLKQAALLCACCLGQNSEPLPERVNHCRMRKGEVSRKQIIQKRKSTNSTKCE
ncbi:MAG: hypothetical protein JAY64_18610, partial [Candidatus Thiodiazotropha weberae]|nr:hypothetical protein [Candidatus Thiodiazotropha lotti]MCW4213165.1 hypothetical protein [Candidatus Thiodiazotropha lotti]